MTFFTFIVILKLNYFIKTLLPYCLKKNNSTLGSPIYSVIHYLAAKGVYQQDPGNLIFFHIFDVRFYKKVNIDLA